jgi:hypothetical protein
MSEHEAHYVLASHRRWLECDGADTPACLIHPTINLDQLHRNNTVLEAENQALRIRVGIALSDAEKLRNRVSELQAVVEAAKKLDAKIGRTEAIADVDVLFLVVDLHEALEALEEQPPGGHDKE